MTDEAQENGAFHDPHVTINRVYTKKGDAGETALVGGQRVQKDDARIQAYGTVDELNSCLGAARQSALEAKSGAKAAAADQLAELASVLLRVQHELFNLGSVLATRPADLHPKQPRVRGADVVALEEDMDRRNATLPTLKSFVLPGGHRLNTDLHLARTVCRRAERWVVTLSRLEEVDADALTYLNRLSDALFVWSRWATHTLALEEVLWSPHVATSATEA